MELHSVNVSFGDFSRAPSLSLLKKVSALSQENGPSCVIISPQLAGDGAYLSIEMYRGDCRGVGWGNGRAFFSVTCYRSHPRWCTSSTTLFYCTGMCPCHEEHPRTCTRTAEKSVPRRQNTPFSVFGGHLEKYSAWASRAHLITGVDLGTSSVLGFFARHHSKKWHPLII